MKIFICLMGLLATGCGKKPDNDLTVFGDSISFGYYADESYAAALADEWNLNLVNYSVSSTTLDSNEQIGMIRSLTVKPGGRILFSPGINDALTHGTDPVYLVRYEQLLEEALDKFEASGATAYVGGPLLTKDAGLNANAEVYANILVSVLQRKGYQRVLLVNTRGKFSPKDDWMHDNVHPNSDGHERIFEIFKEEVR